MKHPFQTKAHHGGADGSVFTGLDFSVNTNPFGANPLLIAAALAADLEHYPDPTYAGVKASLGAFHHLEPACVVPGVGASELLHRIARAVIPPHGVVVSLLPAFGELERAVRLERGYLVTAQPADALRTLEQHEPCLVYISRPNNPLGISLSVAALLEIADWCDQRDALLVLDEAYAPFAADLEAMPAHDRVIRLQSPGKVHGLVGLRLAYALAAPRIARVLENLAPAWVLPASTAAALEVLPNAQGFVRDTVPALRGLAATLARRVSSIATVYHHDAAFFTVEVGDAHAVSRALLLGHKLRVRDCTSFGFPARIRVSAKLELANAALVRALEVVLDD